MIYKIIFLLIGSFLFADPPNWQYNPGDFQFNSWIVGGIVLGCGENLATAGDEFAAFDASSNTNVAIYWVRRSGEYTKT